MTGDEVRAQQERIAAIEAAAAVITTVSPVYLPGLLQPETGARLAFAETTDGADLDELVRARAARQRMVRAVAEMKTITFMVAEEVLCGDAVSAVDDAVSDGWCEIKVITGGRVPVPFEIVDDAVMVETPHAWLITHHDHDLATYRRVVDRLRARSIDFSEWREWRTSREAAPRRQSPGPAVAVAALALPDVMTVAEVARVLRCSKMSVYRWHQRGWLDGFTVGSSIRLLGASVNALITRGGADGDEERDDD